MPCLDPETRSGSEPRDVGSRRSRTGALDLHRQFKTRKELITRTTSECNLDVRPQCMAVIQSAIGLILRNLFISNHDLPSMHRPQTPRLQSISFHESPSLAYVKALSHMYSHSLSKHITPSSRTAPSGIALLPLARLKRILAHLGRRRKPRRPVVVVAGPRPPLLLVAPPR